MAFNMDPKKCPMPTQDPNVRNKNFKKVALGYTAEMAVNEAKRCIHCKNKPCQSGCPVGIDIPEFIAHVAEGDFEAAYQVINRSSSLPAVCGRVCPQESQCEGKCTRGIKNEPVGIGRLERFVADWHRENVHTAPVVPEWNGHKVAIIGAGPAGLTAAGDLAKLGYKVTVYEALHVAGGVLMYGIPEFRLPKAIVQQEIDGLKSIVSMNPIMIDGTGMCGGCRLTVGGQTKFACVDGPDFDGDLVDFDEAMARGTMYRPFEAHAREAACNLFKTQEGM